MKVCFWSQNGSYFHTPRPLKLLNYPPLSKHNNHMRRKRGRIVVHLWGPWCAKIVSVLAPKALRSTHRWLEHCNAPGTCEWITMLLEPRLKLFRHPTAPKIAGLSAPFKTQNNVGTT